MNTPDDPRAPGEGADPTTPQGEPPVEATASPPFDGSYANNHMLGDDLPPLDGQGEGDGDAGRRRFLSGGRLIAAGVAVLVLLGGGVALATSGGSSDKDDEGVASVDGDGDGDGEQASDSGSGDGDAPTPDEMQDAMLEYAQCMRDQGIDMPDPEFSEDGGGVVMRQQAGASAGEGPSMEDFEAADEVCGEIMAEVRADMPQMDPEQVAEMQDKLVVMAQCMRDKGYDFPDPEVSADGAVTSRMGGPDDENARGLDPSSAAGQQMQEDMSACNEEAGLDTPDGEGGPGAGPAIGISSGGDT
jgi:hypothetical protein